METPSLDAVPVAILTGNDGWRHLCAACREPRHFGKIPLGRCPAIDKHGLGVTGAFDTGSG
jgi:hypothetical protein